mmetsp:Transcript_20829/g.40853  ORF Transcript_20829/g.40853 Transcript_20829/m.40853 type:complete len:246 (+) Transcript_20829:1898-2635(+)
MVSLSIFTLFIGISSICFDSRSNFSRVSLFKIPFTFLMVPSSSLAAALGFQPFSVVFSGATRMPMLGGGGSGLPPGPRGGPRGPPGAPRPPPPPPRFHCPPPPRWSRGPFMLSKARRFPPIAELPRARGGRTGTMSKVISSSSLGQSRKRVLKPISSATSYTILPVSLRFTCTGTTGSLSSLLDAAAAASISCCLRSSWSRFLRSSSAWSALRLSSASLRCFSACSSSSWSFLRFSSATRCCSSS